MSGPLGMLGQVRWLSTWLQSPECVVRLRLLLRPVHRPSFSCSDIFRVVVFGESAR
jgi:hypothetical protein